MRARPLEERAQRRRGARRLSRGRAKLGRARHHGGSLSATGRGAVRREADFYPTPAWCVAALLAACLLPDGVWCEPAIGDGAIVRACGPRSRWLGFDIRPEASCDLAEVFAPVDFLETPEARVFDVIITNPPYKLAEPFVRASIVRASHVAMLLRLPFLEGQARAPLHREHPADVFVLSKRPSFTGHGTDATAYAWFVWGPGRGGRWSLL